MDAHTYFVMVSKDTNTRYSSCFLGRHTRDITVSVYFKRVYSCTGFYVVMVTSIGLFSLFSHVTTFIQRPFIPFPKRHGLKRKRGRVGWQYELLYLDFISHGLSTVAISTTLKWHPRPHKPKWRRFVVWKRNWWVGSFVYIVFFTY